MRKINLIFGGSGTNFFAYLGACQFLRQINLTHDKLLGTSGGAIVAASLALGYTPWESYKLALEFFSKYKEPNILGKLFNFTFKQSLLDNKPFVRFFKKVFGDVKLYEYPDLYIVATDMSNCEVVVFNNEDLPIWKAVLASISVPLVFPTVKIGNIEYYDGGVGANFYIDFFKEPTIGFKTRNTQTSCNVKGPKVIKIVSSVINTMIKVQEQERIEDAENSKIVFIDLGRSAMDFAINEEIAYNLFEEGFKQTQKAFESARIQALIKKVSYE